MSRGQGHSTLKKFLADLSQYSLQIQIYMHVYLKEWNRNEFFIKSETRPKKAKLQSNSHEELAEHTKDY